MNKNATILDSKVMKKKMEIQKNQANNDSIIASDIKNRSEGITRLLSARCNAPLAIHASADSSTRLRCSSP
jgi:hypothetical protein